VLALWRAIGLVGFSLQHVAMPTDQSGQDAANHHVQA